MASEQQLQSQVQDLQNQIQKLLQKKRGYEFDQQLDLWTQLHFLKWDPKKTPACGHVDEFKRLVAWCAEVQMPTNETQQTIMFIHTINNRDHEGAARWKAKVKKSIRFKEGGAAKITQVYDDFIKEFQGKERKAKKGSGPRKNSKFGNRKWHRTRRSDIIAS